MFRKISKKLVEWRQRGGRHPLILRGARQVGKTYLVRDLSKGFEHYLEINFEADPGIAQFFTSKDPKTICELLESKFDVPLIDGRSLIFLDELQAADPVVLESLRYFYEKRPGLHVIAAGSLLEFLLDADERKKRRENFSMPVGRIEYMFVGPMDFEEFLLASGKAGLVDWLGRFMIGEEVQGAFHDELNAWLRKYLVIGGMPAVVDAYVRNGVLAAEREQQLILSTYHDDFPKYSDRIPAERLQKVFKAVPLLLGGKFVYSRVDAEERSRELSAAVRLLCLARVMAKVRHTSADKSPIGFGADDRVFKPLFLDVGLCSRALGLKLTDFLSEGDALLVNQGAICEQFIGQHLLYDREEYEEPETYYWVRETSKSQAEVDYITQIGCHIVPVEVKAGTTGTMKGLHIYLNEKHLDHAVRFNADRPSYLADSRIKDSCGRECRYGFLSLPLYMICQYRRLAAFMFEHPDLVSVKP